MTKKTLLFINGHLNTGGVEKSLLDILKHIDYDRFDVDLLLTESLGDYAAQLPPQVNVLLRSIEGTYGSLPKVLLRGLKNRDYFSLKMRLILLLSKFFGQKTLALSGKLLTNNRRYDCAIGFRSGFCTKIAAFAVHAKQKITWWHHGEINVSTDYVISASACDQIAVVSHACKEMLATTFPSLKSKLLVISNMLDSHEICEKGLAFDPYPDKTVLHIVSLGRLAPEKHFENAIFAAAQLKARGAAFRWHLVGDGIMRDRLIKQAQDAGVADCFLFEGNQTNPYPYLKHADLFVHPSYVESQGIVMMEALALGLPCVVTKSLGPCEFLIDGENALLTEQTPESLAEKVLEVISNDALRTHLKQNARCPEQFLPEAVMKKIYTLLEINDD